MLCCTREPRVKEEYAIPKIQVIPKTRNQYLQHFVLPKHTQASDADGCIQPDNIDHKLTIGRTQQLYSEMSLLRQDITICRNHMTFDPEHMKLWNNSGNAETVISRSNGGKCTQAVLRGLRYLAKLQVGDMVTIGKRGFTLQVIGKELKPVRAT